MPLKLTKQELVFLMQFVSPQRGLHLLYCGPDPFLVGESNSWAHQWIRYIRLRQQGVKFTKAQPQGFPTVTIFVNRFGAHTWSSGS
jgi:hypothetical protein